MNNGTIENLIKSKQRKITSVFCLEKWLILIIFPLFLIRKKYASHFCREPKNKQSLKIMNIFFIFEQTKILEETILSREFDWRVTEITLTVPLSLSVKKLGQCKKNYKIKSWNYCWKAGREMPWINCYWKKNQVLWYNYISSNLCRIIISWELKYFYIK